MTAHVSASGSLSIRRQRALFLLALVAGVAGLTGATLVLGRALPAQLASQVEADLAWRAVRGARDLANTAELDSAMINEALAAYAASPDVQAIAVEVGGTVIASRGTVASIASVFAAQPGILVRGDGYLASWAAAIADGAQAGKVAVVVSSGRLVAAQAMQDRVWHLTLIAGATAALLGALVVLRLTRNGAAGPHLPVVEAVQPVEAPASVDDPLAERTRELDRLRRDLRLVLDHTAQGFLIVELGGRMGSERSAVIDRWLGEPTPDAMLDAYLSAHDGEVAAQLGRGLADICAGVPLARCLEQLPRRLISGENAFDIAYAPLMQGDKPERILLILNDVSVQVAAERKQRQAREQREQVALSQLVGGDRAELDEFFAEAAGLLASLEAPSEPEVERRTLRTLKDSCAYVGLETYVELCQRIEDALVASPGPLSDEHRVALANGWATVASQLASMAGA